jgi:phosphohistidine swiveling domain-containing protein
MSATLSATSELVLDLSAIDAGMLTLVGGKAANLGELTRLGAPVPAGICLTTEAYRQVAALAQLDDIYGELGGTVPSDVVGLSALASRARAALLAVRVPDAIADQITAGYARLGDAAPVAVRSSATAEDLPFASFAGQQDTYLNVVGPEAVLEAVVRCWASLWTDRAVVYRATNGIDHRGAQLAVVVQCMVESQIAGVLFTANPVTGQRRETVIDASPGLGEAVVSGAVNPDHFVVVTASRVIQERRLGDKRIAIHAQRGGGTARVELPSGGEDSCITDEQIVALTDLGTRVEAHFGRPQDIEWAIDEHDVLWLTQSRPITTLYPLPVAAPGPDADVRVYFCFSVAQGVYRPITPMGMSALRVIASSAAALFGAPVADVLAGPPLLTPAGQRIFLDVTTAVRSRVGRAVIPRVLGVMEARSAVIMKQLFQDPRLSTIYRSRLPFVHRVGRVALRYLVPVRIMQALVRPTAALARLDRLAAKLDHQLRLPAQATAAQRIDAAERLLSQAPPLLPTVIPGAGAGFAALGLARKLLGPDARPGDLPTVLRGVPNNITTEMDLALWRAGSELHADDASARLFQAETTDKLAELYLAGQMPAVAQNILAEFLRRHGHRAVAEIDLGMPRWSDDPRYILGVLRNYVQSAGADGGQARPDRVFAQSNAEAEAMVETLAGRAAQRGRLRGRLVRLLLVRTRLLVGIRELPKYHLVRFIAAAREQIGLVGAELARDGRIEQTSDVFFLDLGEVRAALSGVDMRALVQRRRSEYDDELRRRHIPRVMLSDGTEPEVRAETAGDLSGTPASAGVVTGTARVMLDPVSGDLKPGEILVAPSTDPGWTPLFLIASGLVMEMGGANSHGAVVAREYGIPAVVGVADATTRISTGQQITVDGTAGTVAIG